MTNEKWENNRYNQYPWDDWRVQTAHERQVRSFYEDMMTLQKMWEEMDAEPHVIREFGR